MASITPSDGIPATPRSLLRSDPTDRTIRGFAATLSEGEDSGVPAIGPDAATSQVRAPTNADADADDISIDGVPVASDDASTLAVTPLDIGYRYAVLKRVAELATTGTRGGPGLRPIGNHGVAAIAVTVDYDSRPRKVALTVRRWREFSAWVRALAIRDFTDLKGTLAGWPPVVKTGAHAVLRQLTEECHRKQPSMADDMVILKL